MAIIIDGKKTSSDMRGEIRERTLKFKEENGFLPGLAVIIVGEDPASQVYVRNKKKDCDEVGFNSEVIALPENTEEKELLALITPYGESYLPHTERRLSGLGDITVFLKAGSFEVGAIPSAVSNIHAATAPYA